MASRKSQEKPSRIPSDDKILFGVMFMTFVTILILVIAIVLVIIEHPQPFTIKIHFLSVTGLNASNLLTTTSWDATVLFSNPNSDFHVVIRSSRSDLLLHYDYGSNDAISGACMGEIRLGPMTQRFVQMKLDSYRCGLEKQPLLDEGALEGIRKVVNKGEISIGIGMKLLVSFYKHRTGTMGDRYQEVKPDCPRVDLQIENATGNGGVIFDQPKICLVPPFKVFY